MARILCRHCGRSVRSSQAYCSSCGSAVNAAAGVLNLEEVTEIQLEDVDADLLGEEAAPTTATVDADDQRTQKLRKFLGVGAAVLAVVMTLSVLSGLGGNSSDDTESDTTAASVADDADTQADPFPVATETAAAPGATPRPTRSAEPEEPEDPNGSAADGATARENEEQEAEEQEAEEENILTGWDRVAAIYDGGGVLAVQRDRRHLDLLDLTTGRWITRETPAASNSYSPWDPGIFPVPLGLIVTHGGQTELRPWDGAEPTTFGTTGEGILAWSDDTIVLFSQEIFFSPGAPNTMVAYRLATGESKAIDIPVGLSPITPQFFGASTYPISVDTGDGSAFWSMDTGWRDIGEGNVVAIERNGVLLQRCDVSADATLDCALETVSFAGDRKPVDDSVALTNTFGLSLSPDLTWVATSILTPTSSAPDYQLVELQTGRTIDAGRAPTFVGLVDGVWLGDSNVFAMRGTGRELRLIDTDSGEIVVVEDVPSEWAQYSPETSSGVTWWVDMELPETAE